MYDKCIAVCMPCLILCTNEDRVRQECTVD